MQKSMDFYKYRKIKQNDDINDTLMKLKIQHLLLLCELHC